MKAATLKAVLPSFYVSHGKPDCMNIYARYFDKDTLVGGYDELMDFLSSIKEIPITQRLAEEVRAYVESDMPYPKRYKIRPRVYFIMIKTSARTMEEFKSHRRGNAESQQAGAPHFSSSPAPARVNMKDLKAARLAEERAGWYLCSITFKRVIQIAGTTKFRYQDTDFTAYVKAASGQECYTRMVEHIKARPEVDLRSQLPSAKGENFSFEYVGTVLPTA